MTMQVLSRHVRLMLRAELLAVQAKLNFTLRRIGLLALAGLFGALGLVLLNMGLFAWLLPLWGPVWTPAGLGLINLALAAIAVLFATLASPGPESAVAEELRNMSAEALESELRNASLLGLAGSLGGGAQTMQLLVPTLTAIIGALSRRRSAAKASE